VRAAALPARALSEVEAKALLRDAGLPMLRETLARSADAAVQAAVQANGPVAMKIVSPDILHKTEIGGVLLGVDGASAVRHGHDLLLTRAAAAAPQARIEGVLVSPMVAGGVETILGVARDPVFGPVVMFGLGGVLAECYQDVSFRVAPIEADEARRMVEETRAAALLRGWRGAPAADVDALIDALVKLARFASEHADTLETVDINPFVVKAQGEGAVALDAVVVGRKT
jgi:acyl-CoA synthetase (NDP forming)